MIPSDLAGLATGLCLGASSLYLRIAMRSEPIAKVIWFVSAFGVVTLGPWAIPALRVALSAEPVAWLGLFLFLAAGLSGQVVGRVFLYSCIARIGPSLGTAYKNAVPLITALFAWTFFGERVTAVTALGTGAVVAGIFVIALFQPRPAREAASGVPVAATREGAALNLPPGLALGIGAVLFYAASDLLRKGGMDLLPSPILGAWLGNLLTFAVISGQLIVTRRLCTVASWHAGALRALFVASTFITAGYVLFLVGVASAGVAVTSALAAIEPLAALAVGKTFYRDQEPIEARQIPGVVLVVAGVAMIVTSASTEGFTG